MTSHLRRSVDVGIAVAFDAQKHFAVRAFHFSRQIVAHAAQNAAGSGNGSDSGSGRSKRPR
jgi:hypothetical protein